ncbi:hypothetical protein SLE2022_133130 [Rubroshorea leprosula]
MAAVVDQHHGFKPLSRSQRCRLQSFTDYNFLDLSQAALAHSIKQFHRSFSTPCLSLATNVEEEYDTSPRIEILGGQGAPRVHALVIEAAMSIAAGIEPIPVSSGLGGAYFLRSRNGDVIAVAKPIDEEPLAFNNPKGFGRLMLGQPGMKRSVRVGETGIRELAAYLLDHGGFAGVPPTALVKISHVAFNVNDADVVSSTPCKVASLQRFVAHDFDAGELGCSGFSVASVHRIGILDIRLLNLDRHAGNILVKKHVQQEEYAGGAAELVPIDHGLCLPERLDDPYFEWLHWPQAAVPFSEVKLEYISNLDPFKDAELLRTEIPSIRESSIRVLILCTIFLKQAAAAGLCLTDIGEMITRRFYGGQENSSVLEDLCAKAKASVVDPCSEVDDEEEDDEDEDESGVDSEETGIFQFDTESEGNCEEAKLAELIQTPHHMAKPPKVPRRSPATSLSSPSDALLSPLHAETQKDGYNSGLEMEEEKGDESENKSNYQEDGRVGGLMKSQSFSVQKYNEESEGISFEDLSEGEWELFLENFEKLLPEEFERTKCTTTSKQRLGTSCKF